MTAVGAPFELNEQQRVAQTLPDEVLRAEATRRGLMAPSLGAATVAREVYANPVEDEVFQTELAGFMDMDRQLPASEQLGLMRQFWSKLGYEMPQLTDQQRTKLQEALTEDHLRIVPTPLMSMEERKAVAERGRVFPRNNFTTRFGALWSPDETWTFGEFYCNPDAVLDEPDGKRYGMRYRTENGNVISRSAYIDSLLATQQAVLHNGVIWTFPVMDARIQAPRSGVSAAEAHRAVSHLSTPESLIALHLLMQANGTRQTVWEVDFTTEAVYELDANNQPLAPADVAGTGWRPGRQRINNDFWAASDQFPYFGSRQTVSGL